MPIDLICSKKDSLDNIVVEDDYNHSADLESIKSFGCFDENESQFEQNPDPSLLRLISTQRDTEEERSLILSKIQLKKRSIF